VGKQKRQEAILALIRKRQIATQDELVRQLHRSGLEATQATVSRDIAELGLVRVAGPDSHYVQPENGLGVASQAGREDRLRRLLRDLPLTVKRGQGLAVLVTLPGSAHTLASALDATAWPEMVGTVAGDDTIFVALNGKKGGYGSVAQRLARLGAYVDPED
jgi:transcriptional regulator of arginine metabolism